MSKNGAANIAAIIITVFIIAFGVMTFIGAVALWVLGHFIEFEFSWPLAIGIGFILAIIAGGYSGTR